MNYFPRCIRVTDAVAAFRARQYHTAAVITGNVIRNRLNHANSVRRSKWYLR